MIVQGVQGVRGVQGECLNAPRNDIYYRLELLFSNP